MEAPPIVAFIAARTAEHDRIAGNAGGRTPSGQWRVVPRHLRLLALVEDGDGETVVYNPNPSTGVADSEDVQHIALHDPSWVVTFADVVCFLLADHAPHEVHPAGLVCARCRLAYPCWTVRTLAGIWPGHPDYNPDWALPRAGDTPDPIG